MSRLRILDFDIENRPLAYLGQDFTTGEITAIAAMFHGEPTSMRVWLLGRDAPIDMLEGFRSMYDAADLVTGHFIRGYDLPVINGAMVEYSLPSLGDKVTVDTKIDLVKHKYLSASQENLCQALGIRASKFHMTNAMWREANRLTPAGLALTEKRATYDVKQHIQLYRRLVELGHLGPPREWSAEAK